MPQTTLQSRGDVKYLRRKYTAGGVTYPYDGPWDSDSREFGLTDEACAGPVSLSKVDVLLGTTPQLLWSFAGMPVGHVTAIIQSMNKITATPGGSNGDAPMQRFKWEIWAGAGGYISRIVQGDSSSYGGKGQGDFSGLMCAVQGPPFEWWEFRGCMDTANGATDPYVLRMRFLFDRLGGVGSSGAGSKPAVTNDPSLCAVTGVMT